MYVYVGEIKLSVVGPVQVGQTPIAEAKRPTFVRITCRDFPETTRFTGSSQIPLPSCFSELLKG